MGSSGSLNHIYRTVWNQALGAMVAVAEVATGRKKSATVSGLAKVDRRVGWSAHRLQNALLSLAIAFAWGAIPALTFANPTGGVAIQGQATITTNGSNLLVTTQNGAGLNHSAINWQSFSIPTGSTTYFQQPNASSTSINRVVTNTPSQIFGTLGSNGNLVLVNQSGITVGAGAVVDTAGFTASSLRMSDADALSGRMRFGDAASATGTVSVMGSVLARSGDVVLMGSSVDTGSNALVQAPNGNTVLAAGQQIEITGRGLEGIVMQVQAPTDSAVNLGTLKGDAVGIFAGTLKHSGLIQATTATLEGGKVVLKAAQRVEDSGVITASGSSGGSVDISTNPTTNAVNPGAVVQSGSIDVRGTTAAGGAVHVQTDSMLATASIDASGANGGGVIGVQAARQAISTSSAHYSVDGGTGKGGSILLSAKASNYTSGTYSATGATGGDITLAGDEIKLASTQLDASGVHGGGSVRVGGLEHGASGFGALGVNLTNASNVYSNSQMSVKADALQDGNGGSLVLWADQNMRASGNLSAKGGAAGGDGGNAEVSGAASLGFSALANLSASHGKAGTLLLDPHNITVTAGSAGWSGLGGTSYLEILDPTPTAAEGFGGYQPFILPSGNIVVASPNDAAMAIGSGAVYMYTSTGTLLSALVGSSAGDHVGSSGLSTFSTGNLLVRSPNWSNGTNTTAGAVTWMDGTTGALSTGGAGGAVSPGNSLVGATLNDLVGNQVLVSGSAAVALSPNWTNGANAAAGAVSWLNGADGKLSNGAFGGAISTANSLVGSAASDQVGSGGITWGLLGGNIAISSPQWGSGGISANAKGAVTWMNWATGALSNAATGGVVSGVGAAPGNSLVGSNPGDRVGTFIRNYDYSYGTQFSSPSSIDQSGVASVNGNLVVISNNWNGTRGAVTWMNGSTGALSNGSSGGIVDGTTGTGNSLVGSVVGDRIGTVSTFPDPTGSPNLIDEVSGLVPLTNGNFLVRSAQWGSAGALFGGKGAVTWFNNASGLSGAVAAANSIVGSAVGDQVGAGPGSPSTAYQGVVLLPNSNYVVVSPNWGGGKGAVTWGNGTSGTLGAVSGFPTAGIASSLTGTTTGDHIGSQGIQLQYGGSNYVVKSPQFSFNSLTNNGAVSWMNGATGALAGGGFAGQVDGTNSLIGSFSSDGVGGEVIPLYNFNFLARTPSWNGGKGALTWMKGATGELATSTVNTPVFGGAVDGISATPNSLVGSGQYDMSGIANQRGPLQTVTQLGNGNLIVGTPQWTNPGLSGSYWDALGAVTWMNGTTGKLSDGSTGGPIGIANSLVGANTGDQVGQGYVGVGIVPLVGTFNGSSVVYNLVIQSQWWKNGVATWAGAATWMDGATGQLVGGASGGTISNSNSLVGTHASDLAGDQILPMNNGNYVVESSLWGDGTNLQVGAVTWGNGLSGAVGDIGSGNSLVGAFANDGVGHSVWPNNGIDFIGNNYLVRSRWNSGAGSLTWVDGGNGHLVNYTTGPNIGGVVAASNSLVGLTQSDNVGGSNLTTLWNGMAVLENQYSDGGKGAVTWMNPVNGTMFGGVPFAGTVSPSNSLVGTLSDVPAGASGDHVGSGGGGVTEITDYSTFSNYVVSSPSWSNGLTTGVGAVTFAAGDTGRVGAVSTSNSLVGTLAGDSVGSWGIYPVTNNETFWNYFVHSPDWGGNKGAITWMNGQTGALNTGSLSGVVGTSNSLVGSTTGDRLGTSNSRNNGGLEAITSYANGNLLVRSEFWNANASALTWMSGANGRLSDGSNGGEVSPSNSLLGSVPFDNLAGGVNGLAVLNGNGNWVVTSPDWDGSKGAATWIDSSNGHLADGTTGGFVSALNSLVGSVAFDFVGGDYACDCTGIPGGITALFNGNYVVNSPDVGALTWGSGTAGVVGTITAANSAPVSVDQIYEYGTSGKVLAGSGSANSNKGGVFLIGAAGSTGLPTFATNAAGDASVGADWLANSLRTGTNLDLQANTDITINSTIDASGGQFAPGTLTLRAGRSVILNAPITTGGADLVVSADDPAAIRANRDAGVGAFVNNAGANALATGAGRWLVYESSPANVTKGGLVPTMYQYGSVFGDAVNTVNPVGSGFVYASGLAVNANFSGQLSNPYGATPTATLGYSLSGLDASDTSYTISQFVGSPTFSYWPFNTPTTTAVGTYPLQYSGGITLPYGSPLGVGSAQSYEVTPAQLTVTAQVGLASKVYDGTASALLNPTYFSLSGFAAGEGAIITKTSGIYGSKNAGSGILVSTTLTSSDFLLGQNTSLSNYILPTAAAVNVGVISPLALTLNTPVVRKTYDGTTTYTTTVSDLAALSAALVTGDTVSSATIKYADKNAGLGNKTAAIAGLTINDGNGGNNYNVTLAGNTTSTIDKAVVTLTAPSITKTYDGTTAYTTTAADLAAMSNVLVSGDSVASATLSYASPNAGSGNKVVTLGAFTINDGNGGANYTLTTNGNANSTINPLTVLWTGNAGTGLWSNTGNWSSPFVPDGTNVITPSTLSVTTAVYDLTAPTSVQSINASGSFTLQSGALNITGDLITPSYTQTGGTLSVSGALTVQNAFTQTAGNIDKTGPVSITQAIGDLTVGNVTGSSITLQAPTGAIKQWPSTGLTGLVTLRTTGGASLMDAANRISGFAVADVVSGGVSTRSSGNIALTNGAAMDLSGISLANGNLSIDNTGGISNSVAIKVDGGTVDIKSHSPITIGNTVTASGNITLAALTPDGTSNITLNGAMTSTAGGISIQAYNNFIQNSNLSAALAIDVSTIAGSLTFGPGAYSIGNPVTYTVNGAPYMPPWIASTLSGGATDFVVAFLDQFQAVLDAQQAAPIDDPLGLMQSSQEGIVVEGEICKP